MPTNSVVHFGSKIASAEMTPSRVILLCIHAGGFATVLHAQAALEYATRSAGSALSDAGSEMHIGVCALDIAVVPCVHQYYPTSFYLSIVFFCFFLGILLRPRSRF